LGSGETFKTIARRIGGYRERTRPSNRDRAPSAHHVAGGHPAGRAGSQAARAKPIVRDRTRPCRRPSERWPLDDVWPPRRSGGRAAAARGLTERPRAPGRRAANLRLQLSRSSTSAAERTGGRPNARTSGQTDTVDSDRIALTRPSAAERRLDRQDDARHRSGRRQQRGPRSATRPSTKTSVYHLLSRRAETRASPPRSTRSPSVQRSRRIASETISTPSPSERIRGRRGRRARSGATNIRTLVDSRRHPWKATPPRCEARPRAGSMRRPAPRPSWSQAQSKTRGRSRSLPRGDDHLRRRASSRRISRRRPGGAGP